MHHLRHAVLATLVIPALFCMFSASAASGAECPADSKQTLSGAMSEATSAGDGTWIARVHTAAPCSVLFLQGKGRIPPNCGQGEDFSSDKKFRASGSTNFANTLQVTSIQCSR